MNADIAIITTLEEEFDAIVKALGLNNGEREVKINGWNIICLQSPRRGNRQSAITTTKSLLTNLLSNNNNLQYIFLVGYAGGIKDRESIELGDVVVSSTVRYYQYQKIDNDIVKYRDAESRTIPPSPKIIEKVNKIKDNVKINDNKILIGEVLSGETIINITINNNWLNQFLDYFDKALAVETEAQGVFEAVHDFVFDNNKVIHAAVIKGISDFINSTSSDRDLYKNKASKHAAIVTRELINLITKDKKPTALIEQYLNYIEDLYHTPNKIDRKPLSSYYIEPKLIKVDIDTWNKDRVNDNKIKGDNWSINKFLSTDGWLTIIGSEFGIGKSSYAKYIANRLAKSHLESNSGYIPILVNLAHKNDIINANIYLNYNLEQILSKLPNDASYNKILLILDGLDEYNGKVEELINRLRSYDVSYKKERGIDLKVLITTRMIDSYTDILKNYEINEYVRIKPFDEEQINEFFKKYEVNLTYKYLEYTIGLSDDEILKPLFAWIIAYMHKEGDGLRKIDVNKLDLKDDVKYMIVRTVLYHNFISALVRGKHRDEALDKLKASYIAEKKLLRVLSAINNIYGKIEGDINKLIEPFNINYDNIDKALEYIIESYLYISIANPYKPTKVYQFIHKSMQEYLLAEYLYENIKNNNIHKLAIGLPSKECIDFLHGLIAILKYYDEVKDMLDYPEYQEYQEYLEPLVNKDDTKLVNGNDINKIITNCKSIIKDDKIILYDTENKDGFIISKDNNANRYSNLYIHKWVAVNILSWLSNEEDRKLADIKERLSSLIRETSHNIESYLKYLKYSKLSYTKRFKAYLSYTNLFEANLSYADLSEANLSGANLSGANLFEALLFEADLSGALLLYANLSEANLSEANLSGANLSGANLSGANLFEALLFEADLSYANLSGAKLFEAKLSYANLSGADLSGAKLSGALLSYANLSGAKLSGANLPEANLYRTNLSGANLPKAKLSGAKLSGANLSYADLSKTNLSGANLSYADLSGANLSRANLSKTNLFEANLFEANLFEADLSYADLSKTNLSGANLSYANLSGADLSGAKLSGAKLSNVIFYLFSWKDEDIRNSNLANYIELYGINIQECKLTRNDKITLIKDYSEITIELKDNKAILTIDSYELELDVIKEDNQTKIFIPIKVDKYTNTKGIILTGIILTNSNDKESIKKALSNLHPNLREIVLRDNPNYKEIWDESIN